MEAGLDGPDRDPHRGGDLRQGHPEEEVLHDDRPPFGVEAAQRVIELLALGDPGGVVGDGWHQDRGQLDLDRSTAATSRHVDAGIAP